MREMKESGVEWIGEIPAHWSPIRFRFIAKITTGNQDTQNADPDGEYPFYVRSPIVERCNNYTFDGKGILMAGDGAGAGRVFHLVDGKYAVHQRVYRFYDFKYMYPVLLKYYLENLFATVMDYGSAKTTVPSVRLPMIQDFVVCVPPKKEQDNIVAVLNEKCAQVGSLISNVQAQIEKLKAYKQSLITEVVTKGLDPKAEMKDSGIEWIGEIPAHWTTIANKYVMRKKKRICEKWKNQNVLSLTMNGVVVRDILNPVGKMPTTFDGYQFAYSGELLMCLFDIDVTPRCVGRVFCDGVTSPAYSCFQLNNHADLGYYYYYYLMVDNTKELLHLAKNLRHSFTEEQLGMLKVPFPPFKEQSTIAAYLDTQCAKIDELSAEKLSLIADLEAYKKSLIYEVVTGKRRVC